MSYDRCLPNFKPAQLDEIAGVDCPCGVARRAFGDGGNQVATLPMVDISADSRVHYHRRTTEICLVLKGDGHLELDGELYPVRPLSAVFIKPGCRHRAVDRLRMINIPVPAFDPADEWFDGGAA